MFQPLLVLPVLATLLAGCSAPAPAPRPPAAATPLTSRILAAIVQDRLPTGDAAYDARAPRAVSGTVRYRATVTVPAWTITVEYGPSPGWLATSACRAARGVEPVQCFTTDGVRVAYRPKGRDVLLVAPRGDRFVTLHLAGAGWAGDPRTGDRPADLDQLVALAADPRIDATTDARLSLPASNVPNWREDLDCANARRAGTVALPARVRTGRMGDATPQAFAAVIASQVNARCVGEWAGTGDELGALAYLSSATEWLAAYVTTDPAAGSCPAGWEPCRYEDGAVLAYRFERPAEYPAKVRLSRPLHMGHLVVEQASLKARPDTMEFPVPLDTMRRLSTDDHLGFTTTTALTAAGNRLPLCWRIAPRVDTPPEATARQG